MNLNSYLTLTINPTSSPSVSFKITKAIIKESLEELFSIECEGYIEGLSEDLFSLNSPPNPSLDSNPSNANSSSSHSKTPNFHPKVLIDTLATLDINNPYENKTLNFDTNATKTYQGIISYVNYLGIHKESLENLADINSKIKTLKYKHFFSFKLESILKRLSLNKANRIYTHTTILEAIKETLHFYQGLLHKEIDFSNIHLEFENQELISQYNESDLDFITRLAHNNGIFFYEDASKIYFCDHYAKSNPKTIKYNPNINNALNEPCITQIYKEQSLRTNSFTHSSTNAKTPLNLLSLNSNQVPYEENLNNKASYNAHTYESEYSFSQSIDLKTLPALKEKRTLTLNESLQAKSNIYHLSLEDFIAIDYHTFTHSNSSKNSEDLLKDFVIVASTQTLIDDAILVNSIHANDNTPLKDLALSKSYSNTLTLLPSHIIFTPPLKQKPKAPNSTQGIVIGESSDIENQSNTIYTDDYGRVKVRMNLYANQEELDDKEKTYHHTPFLRVATSVANSHSGFYHTPRIGDEVIISFLDDDIDKPYVSGSLYNSTSSMPQYNYPRYKREIASNTLNSLSQTPKMINKGLEELKLQEDTDYVLSPINHHYLTLANSTIGVENTQAKARNEITLKNDKDKEEIYILAQKDYKTEIGNDYEETIKMNKTSEVGALYTEFITLGHMQNIAGFKNVNVKEDYLENTLLSKETNVKLNNTLNVGV
ncbi:type VI secretion system tip protein VgrG, partial [Helicobacter sp. MIT 11-5569]|uniref:type VI secretion system Vgr family protein n=1 Tax=Helicobacter sp. MIT 11-5569 TaxID=1548151 RepID=UPI0010FEF310